MKQIAWIVLDCRAGLFFLNGKSEVHFLTRSNSLLGSATKMTGEY